MARQDTGSMDGCFTVIAVVVGGLVLAVLEFFGEQIVGSEADSSTKIYVGILLAAVICTLPAWLWYKRTQKREKADAHEREIKLEDYNAKALKTHNLGEHLSQIILDKYQSKTCPRCQETRWRILDVTPSARSIHAECVSCSRKAYIKAVEDDLSEILALWNDIRMAESIARSAASEVGFAFNSKIEFEVTDAGKNKHSREKIPEHVRQAVWKRDGGCCVKCGATEDLQFDHIIPFSKGGATSIENLQILCGTCNREKSNKI